MPHVPGEREEPGLGPRRPLVGRRHQAKSCDPSFSGASRSDCEWGMHIRPLRELLCSHICGHECSDMRSARNWSVHSPPIDLARDVHANLRDLTYGSYSQASCACRRYLHISSPQLGERSRLAVREPAAAYRPSSNDYSSQLRLRWSRHRSTMRRANARLHAWSHPRFCFSLALAHRALWTISALPPPVVPRPAHSPILPLAHSRMSRHAYSYTSSARSINLTYFIPLQVIAHVYVPTGRETPMRH
ncbi:hypothetical protein OH76DRAFT_461859 [Lentinus brumalis]|uniref:Uncharacterized protein n=1 Tax=Lentinus brumalis TaxID=2498619 RepID=A0A371DCK2_9APHY|nr:hypothetical protein OH76DRAFT_461859 [Polyporus brumalis]